jgi:hypothetical protein
MLKITNLLFTFLAGMAIASTASFAHCQTDEIDLSGEWAFALDPGDVGIREQWSGRPLKDKIKLPGSLQEQGLGDDVGVNTRWTVSHARYLAPWLRSPQSKPYRQAGNFKLPFWLQPDKHYVGAAWYQHEVNIPSSWKDKCVTLELERTHWETTLFVNGKEIGKREALLTPHRYIIKETGKLLLTLRVDNRVRIPVGVGAHSVTDHAQTNWNGVTGKITLSARPAFHIDAVRVYPDVKAKKAKVEIDLDGKAKGKAKIALKAKSFNCDVPAEVKPVTVETDGAAARVVAELELGDDMLTWSEYAPNLYRLNVELTSECGTDTKTVDFGMREFRANGTRFTVNGMPVFLRGTLECCVFPLTGYPPMSADYWTKIYRCCKAFGLNHIRFHSWCPPEVAFEVADREGIYLQVECGAWTTVGAGGYIDKWLYAESERIIKEYGNHPSFCMFLYGNEPEGRNRAAYLSKFVDYWKVRDARRVYTSGAGYPYVPNADYWSTYAPRIHADGNRNTIEDQPPQTAFDWRTQIKGKTMPSVSHETGQWCVYPNFKEIPKYTGVLKAKNFEIFRDFLNNNHLGDMAEKFLHASGRFQTLCYKADIEALLRTPGIAGFQLLGLRDFPGHGTALVGVLDAFWDKKGYVDEAEYGAFCNGVVPLARMEKLIWTNNETFKAVIEVAHFAAKPLPNAAVEWELTDAVKHVLAKGKTVKDLPIDNCVEISKINYDLSGVKKPSQLTLTARIAGTKYVNIWHVWVYPETTPPPENKPYFTTDFNEALAKARAGGNVLYCLTADKANPKKIGSIAFGFAPIFWNTALFPREKPNTLGIYCDSGHPALAAFPNEGHSDFQWWDVVKGSVPLVMNDFPASHRPVVYIIDDWYKANRLGLLFEAKVGRGKLMVCGANLDKNLEKRPAARQFRRSIEQYMASDKFNPREELNVDLLKGLHR